MYISARGTFWSAESNTGKWVQFNISTRAQESFYEFPHCRGKEKLCLWLGPSVFINFSLAIKRPEG
jgi:hypothetical protein